jgi:hypothetical protein
MNSEPPPDNPKAKRVDVTTKCLKVNFEEGATIIERRLSMETELTEETAAKLQSTTEQKVSDPSKVMKVNMTQNFL